MSRKATQNALLLPTGKEISSADMLQAAAKEIDGSNPRFEPKDSDTYAAIFAARSNHTSPHYLKGMYGATGGPRQQNLRPLAEPSPPVAVRSNGNDKRNLWLYEDDQGVHGPYTDDKMAFWFACGKMNMSLSVKRTCDEQFQTLGQLIKDWGCFPFKSQEETVSRNPSMSQTPFKSRHQPCLSQHPSRPMTAPRDYGNPPARLGSPELGSQAHFKAVLEPLPSPQGRKKGYYNRRDQRQPLDLVPNRSFIPISAAENSKFISFITGDSPEGRQLLKKGEGAASVKPRLSTRGAWGGYENTSYQRRPIPQPTVASRPIRQPPRPQPSTWAGVCQQPPVGPVESWEQPQPPIDVPFTGRHTIESVEQKSTWDRRCVADREFTRRSYECLGALPSYVHVPRDAGSIS